MIGILGGMGTQAGLDFCNKLAVINRGKSDEKYAILILYNESLDIYFISLSEPFHEHRISRSSGFIFVALLILFTSFFRSIFLVLRGWLWQLGFHSLPVLLRRPGSCRQVPGRAIRLFRPHF